MTDPPMQRNPVEEMAEEFLERYRRGERPALTEYARKHPELSEKIRELFPALVMLEEVGPQPPGLPGACKGGMTPDGKVLERLGDYRILREVARGGMGVVYEAEQEALGRHVALKVLPYQSPMDPIRLGRFRRESRSAARLHHTNIVPVFDVGEYEGTHYYAMQFIRGQALDEVLTELKHMRGVKDDAPATGSDHDPALPPIRHLTVRLAQGLLSGELSKRSLAEEEAGEPPPQPAFENADIREPDEGRRENPSPASASAPSSILKTRSDLSHSVDSHYFRSAAQIGLQVAEALAYAHTQKVLHRDIKPANLLLDFQGTVWVTDFGLAKEDGDDLTQTGDLVGTLRYMAPERFNGMSDPRSDIYSLGLTLYELLTLRPGFEEADRSRLIKRIMDEEPVRPRQRDPQIPRDLETIVLKAIAKDPKQRYQVADEMAEDLRRFLADRPIRARRSAAWEHVWRWCRRNPSVASLLGLIAAMIVVIIVGVIVKNAELGRALQDSNAANQAANVRLWESLLGRARAVRMSGQPGQRIKCLETIQELLALPLPENHSRDELRTEGVAALALPDLELVREWEGLPDSTHTLAFDPTVTCYARISKEGVVSLRSVADDRELLNWTEEGFAPYPVGEGQLKLSPGGRYVAIQQPKLGLLRVRRLDGTNAVLCHETPLFGGGYGWDLTFRSDGTLLLYSRVEKGDRNVEHVVFNLDTGATRKLLLGTSLAWVQFSPDGKRLSGITPVPERLALLVCDLESGKETARIPLPRQSECWCWHPHGRWLAIGSSVDVRLLDGVTGKLLRTFEGGIGRGCRLAFSPSGDFLFTNSWAGILRAWEVSSGRQVLSRTAAGYPLLACGPGGEIPAVSATDSRRLQVFRFHETHTIRTLKRLKGAPGSDFNGHHLFSRDGRWLLSATADHTREYGIAVLDVDQRIELAFLDVPDHQPLAWDKDGSLLGYGEAGLLRWPLQSAGEASSHYRLGPPRRMKRRFIQHEPGVDDARRTFAFADYYFGAIRWSPDQSEIPLGPQRDVRSCAVSPDGRWIATGSHGELDDGLGFKVWNAETGKLIKGFPIPGGEVLFSPDGRWLYTNSIGGKLWHTGTWEEAHTVGGPRARFSPDSQLLAVESGGGAVRIITPENACEVVRLEGPDRNRVWPSCFSPDGAKLVTFGVDLNTLHIWDLRALRTELSSLGLDWDAPPYPPARPGANDPSPQITIDLGNVKEYTEADRLLDKGYRHWNAKEFPQAIDALRQAHQKDPDNPATNSYLAYILATGPNELRNTKEAVFFARKGVELVPRSHQSQNTLGIALYRDGRPAEAIPILELSLQYGAGQSDAFDLYFLAMSHWQLGQKETARKCYKQAVEWEKKNSEVLGRIPQWTEECRRFRAETAELLGIEKSTGP